MASLVADYGASSGESDDNEKVEPTSNRDVIVSNKPKNLLTTCDSDSDDDSDLDGQSISKDKNNPNNSDINKQKNTLPNPLAGATTLPQADINFTSPIQNSVFVTQFQKAEADKNSILEKHVKMTSEVTQTPDKGKKKCWNFVKGRCRFGHKCKYSHGNDIQVPIEDDQRNENVSAIKADQTHQSRMFQQNIPLMQEQDIPDEDSYMSNAKRKKKHGVTDYLVPPKKAMTDLTKMRAKERPWTVQQ